MNTYVYNEDCGCKWCLNGGHPPVGYWVEESRYGRVYQGDDSYEQPHRPPPPIRTVA